MKKVLIISTGGTIAMKHDPDLDGLVPAVTGKDLVEAVPGLEDLGPIEVVEFSNIPSPHMTPRHMADLAKTLEKSLKSDEVTGAVISHGTDTLEETAYFLDLVLKTTKPLALTAAMKSPQEVSADGPGNILASVRTVRDPQAQDCGVLVVANDQVHSAQTVTKTHTSNTASFQSPFWGPLAYVDSDRVHWRYRPKCQKKFDLGQDLAYEDVYLVKMYTGANPKVIDLLVQNGAKGLVIEALGIGNVPPQIGPSLKKALDQKIPVVIASRCLGGRTQPSYAYQGGGKTLEDMGAVFAGDINGPKARLKLILALNSQDYSFDKIQSYFDEA